jgi:pimeloyl-ACP methyl ester carboxylesterase
VVKRIRRSAKASGATGVIDVLSTDTETGPIVGPKGDDGGAPRLARHRISLADGHEVGVSVCGRGVPIVLVHGFTAEGMLYAQTLNRIVAAGFKVVAIDTAGHGSTQGLPTGGANFESYTRLLMRAVDELGIKKAVFAGHSMGGRLVLELAAREPERVLAVLLLDAIVGEPWDRIVAASRFNPLLLAGIGAILVADSISTVPMLRNPRQAAKFGKLVAPTLLAHVRNPLHLAGPGVSILRSRSSKWMLEKLGREHVPVVAIHGDRDIVVPLATARSAAKLSKGMVVVVEGGTHSWLLKDPETLPAILRDMFDRPASRASRARDFAEMGLEPDASIDEIEAAFYDDDAAILRLTPPLDLDAARDAQAVAPKPRYRWHIDHPR